MLDVAVRKSSPTHTRSTRVPVLTLSGLMLLAPVALVSLSFWPGHMNADTLSQLQQVMTGDLDNRHATLLLAIWMPFWDIGVGPGFVLTGQVIVFVVGMFLLLRSTFSTVVAALATMLVSLSPPVFGMLGLLGRDVWFIAFLLLAFGLLAAVPNSSGRPRTALIIGVIVAAWLALAARQNAAPAVMMAMIAWVALLRGSATDHRFRRTITTALGGIGVTVALMATQFVITTALDVRNVHPEQYLYTYDVAALSHRERENLFPPDVMPDRGITAIDEHFMVDNVVPMLAGPGHPVEPFLSGPQAESLGRAWRTAVLDHPLDYLDARWELFWRQVALTQPAAQIYHPWIDGNQWNLKVRFPEANDTAKQYVESFADAGYNGGVLFRIWMYLLAALAIGIYFVVRGRTMLERSYGAFALSAVTYQAGIAIGSMGVGYRVEYPSVVIAIVSVLLLIGALMRRRRGQLAT